jgi:hypothetical protein
MRSELKSVHKVSLKVMICECRLDKIESVWQMLTDKVYGFFFSNSLTLSEKRQT